MKYKYYSECSEEYEISNDELIKILKEAELSSFPVVTQTTWMKFGNRDIWVVPQEETGVE